MKTSVLIVLASLLTLATTSKADPAPNAQLSIERLDPALDALLDSKAKIEVLDTGFKWSEGPVWYDHSIVFSDVPHNVVYRWKEGDAKVSVLLKPSGETPGDVQGSNGLARDAQGRLLLCEQGDSAISRWENGKFTKLASSFNGKRFNSPNDLCVHKDGSIFFTDPPYGMKKGSTPEIPFHGVYKVSPEGKVSAIIEDIKFPNGIALSTDQKTLYIAISDSAHTSIRAYDLDGKNGREIFDATPLKSPERKGACDGMKVDQQGNIWTTGPGGILILSKEGKHLGTIMTGQPTGNCAFGGDDGSYMYITANMMLLRVKTKVHGDGF